MINGIQTGNQVLVKLGTFKGDGFKLLVYLTLQGSFYELDIIIDWCELKLFTDLLKYLTTKTLRPMLL